MLTVDDIARLFAVKGGSQYSGEPVSQLEHALQCAWLAEQSDADDELVTAALLHDIGHLVADRGDSPTLRGVDDLHQFMGTSALRGLFPGRVLDAIRWHVDAKRYLCAVRPAYRDRLSEDSRRSLLLQGGVFTDAQAQAFIRRPHADEAVRVRAWDDLAKQADVATPPLDHFLARASRCVVDA